MSDAQAETLAWCIISLGVLCFYAYLIKKVYYEDKP